MKVNTSGNFVNILPTDKAASLVNYMNPKPKIDHVTYSITETKVAVHDLITGRHESCLFADFEGDVPYTTAADIVEYLDTLLSAVGDIIAGSMYEANMYEANMYE